MDLLTMDALSVPVLGVLSMIALGGVGLLVYQVVILPEITELRQHLGLPSRQKKGTMLEQSTAKATTKDGHGESQSPIEESSTLRP